MLPSTAFTFNERVVDRSDVYNKHIAVGSKFQVILGNSVEHIIENTFNKAKGLENVIFGDSVKIIERFAFHETGLTSVTFGVSVKKIGLGAFANCTELKSVTFGDSVTEIGACAFDGCTKLERVCIPDSVDIIIKHDAFRSCPSLNYVRIPKQYIGRDELKRIFGENIRGPRHRLTTAIYTGIDTVFEKRDGCAVDHDTLIGFTGMIRAYITALQIDGVDDDGRLNNVKKTQVPRDRRRGKRQKLIL